MQSFDLRILLWGIWLKEIIKDKLQDLIGKDTYYSTTYNIENLQTN